MDAHKHKQIQTALNNTFNIFSFDCHYLLVSGAFLDRRGSMFNHSLMLHRYIRSGNVKTMS